MKIHAINHSIRHMSVLIIISRHRNKKLISDVIQKVTSESLQLINCCMNIETCLRNNSQYDKQCYLHFTLAICCLRYRLKMFKIINLMPVKYIDFRQHECFSSRNSSTDAMSGNKVHKKVRDFKDGQENIHSKQQSGKLSLTTEDFINTVDFWHNSQFQVQH